MKSHKSRRGIILLLILALLALFGMVAVAFVVLTSQTLKSTQALQRKDIAYYPPNNDLNEAAMQAIRGTANPISKMASQSLLEDIYGSKPITGAITGVQPVCGGQLIEITVNVDPPALNLTNNIGSVLTIKSATTTAYGLSTRIVGFNPTNGNPQILAFPNGAIPPVGTAFIVNGMPFTGTGAGANPLTGKLDLHHAYNNDPSVLQFQLIGNLTLPNYAPAYPTALLPFLPLNTYTSPLTNPPDLLHNLPNGMPFPQLNEDYDAADYQNLLLATPLLGNRLLPSMHRPALVNYWYQKLFLYPNPADPTELGYMLSGITDPEHRWQAIFHPVDAYKKNWIVSPTAAPPPPWTKKPTPHEIVRFLLDLKRNIIGRPSTDDHPNFNGSNPSSNASYYHPGSGQKFSWECGDVFTLFSADQQPHWDVDTDGDGTPDAIWLDIGLPVRTTPDGRKYKPLVAYYCLDMDGRLNLNAHGNLAQANTANPYAAQVNAGTNSRLAPDSTGGLVQQTALLRGQGIGPADINLAPLFQLVPADYQKIFLGNGVFEGRYGGIDSVSGIAVPGKYSENYLGFNKFFNLPDNFGESTAGCGGYGTFADLKGTVAIGLDPRGQPLYQNPLIPPGTSLQTMLLPDPAVPNSTNNPYFGMQSTNPYAINLSPQAIKGLPSSPAWLNDNPFSVSELERILRPYDKDSTNLPARLKQLAYYLIDSRHLITTESHDLPCQVAPKVPDTWKGALFHPENDLNSSASTATDTEKEWIRSWYPLRTIVDLLTARYYNDYRNAGQTVTNAMSLTQTAITGNVPSLFPPELASGLKMNLNRPFTDQLQLYTSPGVSANINVSYHPDGLNPLLDPATGLRVLATEVPLMQQSKQMHARHLYVLMMLLKEYGVVHFNELNAGINQNKLTTRRIAQWAINAVDFMTPDSAMTPFEYDEDPFNPAGWRVDGRIDLPGAPVTDDTQPYRGLVWGCKQPDLLLMESLNIHDRRVADTDMDPSNKKRTDSDGGSPPAPADLTLDQPQIPQGSTFIELYCTRNDTNPQAPSDLYSYNSVTNRWYLELGRMAPAWNATAYSNKFNGQTLPNNLKRAYPVWRLVVGDSNATNPNNNAATRFLSEPKTFTPQTQQIKETATALASDLLNDMTKPITIDRIVWFANMQPITQAVDSTSYHADAERIYYYRAGTNVVPGGEYLVVGPRWITHIGSKSVLPGAITSTNFWGDLSPQTISLNPVNFINNSAANMYPNTASQIKMPQAMIVATEAPTTWTDATLKTNGIGLSISEPIPGVGGAAHHYYAEPTVAFKSAAKEWYGKPDDNTTRTFLKPQDSRPGTPLQDENLLGSKTTPHYKTFFLQRLANPSEPFEPSINPYITVDWMPADLTVFNGMDYMSATDWSSVCSSKGFTASPFWDTDDPVVAKPNDLIRLASRQRGYDAGVANNIWNAVSLEIPKSTQDALATNLVFPYNANTTLGYLNLAYWDRTRVMAWNATWKDWDGSTPAPLWRDQSNPSLPNTNPLTQPWITSVTPDLLTGNPPATPVPQYYGDPLSPYPWFAWNNRPYNNVYELMLVPSDDPGRMLKNYSISITPKLYEPASESEPPFPSLLDFFVSKSFDPAYLNNPPSLYRIFDYLQVPSSFVAEETQARPDNAGVWGNPGDHNFHPPFHKISNYRDTGKINLNTIYDSQVFDGLMNSFPGGWTNDFIRSRKGFGNQTDILEKDPVVPTEFARPFRSSGNAQLTPITPDLAGTDTSAYDREISATILRARPNSGNPRVTDNENLIFQFPSGIPWCNDAQNAYFKYLGVERLGNLTTTRSNVYALWVTVGYFEVKPAPRAVNMPDADHPWMIPAQLNMTVDQLQLLIDQIYPDKYELGQELGSDTGEIVRHRGFYLIDRSIPVGFQRGQDLNVEKSILLKRFIE